MRHRRFCHLNLCQKIAIVKKRKISCRDFCHNQTNAIIVNGEACCPQFPTTLCSAFDFYAVNVTFSINDTKKEEENLCEINCRL